MTTRIFKIDRRNPDSEALNIAADVIRHGGLVAFPTETVYGLAANYRDQGALERIYAVKGRPAGKPLTVQVADKEALAEFITDTTPAVKRLIDAFWPGPLTLVLRSKDGAKIGIRIPRNKIAQLLIKESGAPIVAPSANLSGEKPPKTAGEVAAYLGGKIDIILDGGATDIGIESTVLDVTAVPFTILRQGAISKDAIKEAAKEEVRIKTI